MGVCHSISLLQPENLLNGGTLQKCRHLLPFHAVFWPGVWVKDREAGFEILSLYLVCRG